jgi:hypothetical protein
VRPAPNAPSRAGPAARLDRGVLNHLPVAKDNPPRGIFGDIGFMRHEHNGYAVVIQFLKNTHNVQ